MDLRHEEPEEVLQVQAAGVLLKDLPAGALQQDPQEPLQVPGWNQGQGGVNPHKEELSQVLWKPLYLLKSYQGLCLQVYKYKKTSCGGVAGSPV